MKLIIVALAFVALAHGQVDNVKPKVCTPGSTKNIECNSCFCVEDGSGWGCTQIGCYSGVLTIANSDGSTSQSESTDSSDRSKRDTESANESPVSSTSIENIQVCKPGDTKRVECNNCFCTNDGARWACTKKGCGIETIAILESGAIATQP